MSSQERYDFFILSDVSADQVSLGQMDAIERYVRDLGGGFLFAGGERGYGLGSALRLREQDRAHSRPSVSLQPRGAGDPPRAQETPRRA